MHFIYPGFLFALFTLAIPIIIHLFNFRRFKKIYFTNVRFLKEIRQDTQSHSRLKNLLILISRLLAVAFLVFAFAQPYIPITNKKAEAGTRRVSIFVDNSFSMDAMGKNGSLLETAKKKAREIALAYDQADQFQILTASFEARHQRLVSREEFLLLIDEIKPASSVRTLSEVVQRQQDAISHGDVKTTRNAYIISDFQKSISDEMNQDTSIQYFFVRTEASRLNNIYIDTCFLSTPFIQLNTPNELVVVIRNKGNADSENIPLKFSINGVQKSLASIAVPKESSRETRLSFTISEPGWQKAELTLTDFPVTFDDKFYFSFNVRRNLEILCINGKEKSIPLNSVFGNDDYFNLKNQPAGQVDYSAFRSSQLIILHEVPTFSSGMIHELDEYTRNGGTIFIIPAEDIDYASYNELMNALGMDPYREKSQAADKVVSIEQKSELFAEVFERGKSLPENLDLPVVNRYYIFGRNTRSNSQSVMRMQNGSAFLASGTAGKGSVYALASPLQNDASGFPRHALFVPVFIRAALQGTSEIKPPLVIGNDNDFLIEDTLVSNDNVFHLTNPEIKFDFIPESRMLNSNTVISVHDQVTVAGNYELFSGEKLISAVSFNYDRKESDLEVLSNDELKEIANRSGISNLNLIDDEGGDLTHKITQLNEGKRLWKYCVIAALIFLAIEILLIRYFNRKTVTS